jgi:hypothetical protein
MARPKSDVCDQGHKNIVEDAKGRRRCNTCHKERQQAYLKRARIKRLEADRIALLGAMKDAPQSTQDRLAAKMAVVERRIDDIETGKKRVNRSRRRVVKVRRADGVLCAACEAKVFPVIDDLPDDD